MVILQLSMKTVSALSEIAERAWLPLYSILPLDTAIILTEGDDKRALDLLQAYASVLHTAGGSRALLRALIRDLTQSGPTQCAKC